jgi:hypothetical protein
MDINPVYFRGKIQCHYAGDSRVEGSNPGSLNEVNHVSSSVLFVGASRWCAITHVFPKSLISSIWSFLEPRGVSCLNVIKMW